MSDSVTVTGMVLTAMPIGEFDKRITILTTDRGKITAFARGARRPKSSLLACTNPFAFGEFELFPGKNAYTLQKADISNYFRELTADPMAAYLGFYFCEFAEYCCQENNDEKEMLKLLYQTLKALGSASYDNRLVRLIYEDKAMTLNGIGPNEYSLKDKRVSESALYTLSYIANSPVEKLYSFKVSEPVLKELTDIIRSHYDKMIRHSFKSLEVLSELT